MDCMVGIIKCQRNYIHKNHWLVRKELERYDRYRGMNVVTLHNGSDDG